MERFRATTTWKVLRIESEPYLVMAYRGYALVVATRELSTDQEYELLITGIKSLAEPLEQLRKANGNLFTGLQFGIRKESKDRSSQYQLDPKKVIKSRQNDGGLDKPLPKSQTHEERLWERITKRYKDYNSTVEHVSQGQRSEAADYIEGEAVLQICRDCTARIDLVFPDKNLEAVVREEILWDLVSREQPLVERITRWHLKNLECLTADREWEDETGIADLSGLEHAVNLTHLWLDDNEIIDVSPLASLINLTHLWLDSDEIIDVSPLASLTNLTKFFLSSSRFSDVSPLASLTNLTMLYLPNNEISNISPLASLTKLTRLSLARNQISDITPLTSLTNLMTLDLRANPLSQKGIAANVSTLESRGVDVRL